MERYEQISENCKLLWREGFELTNQKHTQVSCYAFNENGELLIVKNGKSWTIPGVHPENNETYMQTLARELMEEACVTLKEEKYLGAVEVIENGETYYQIRYTAKVDKLLPFKQEWEICERKFVKIKDLSKYIPKISKGKERISFLNIFSLPHRISSPHPQARGFTAPLRVDFVSIRSTSTTALKAILIPTERVNLVFLTPMKA